MSQPLAVVRLHSNDSSLFLVSSYHLAPRKSYTLVPFCWQYSSTTWQKPQVFLSWWFLDDVKLSLEIYPFDDYRTIHLNLNPMLQCCTLIKMSVNPYKTSHISNIRKVSPLNIFFLDGTPLTRYTIRKERGFTIEFFFEFQPYIEHICGRFFFGHVLRSAGDGLSYQQCCYLP